MPELSSNKTNASSSLSRPLRSPAPCQYPTELDDLEFRIIELRYGLADGREYSHEEIASLLSITPEKVRDIEAAAVAKLKPTSS